MMQEETTIVGKYVLYKPEGLGWHQGKVLGEVAGRALVTWFSWMTGYPTWQVLITYDELASRQARFFDDEDEFLRRGSEVTREPDA